jgi:hypothetical protein
MLSWQIGVDGSQLYQPADTDRQEKRAASCGKYEVPKEN